jgi:hypothetical protein
MYIPHKVSIFIGLAALALIPLIAFHQGGTGNGTVVESERQVGSFTRIASSGSAEIRIHRSPDFRVVIAASAGLQELFEARTADGLLSLGFRPGAVVRISSRLIVHVYLPELESISLSGSGKAVLMDRFDGKDLRTIISGSGSIQGTVHYDTLAAAITGSGSIRLSGVCPQQGITISGSGSFDGRQLPAVSASAIMSGSGSIRLDVGSSLDASIAGSGSIRYSGDPVVNTRIAGTGTVRKTGG